MDFDIEDSEHADSVHNDDSTSVLFNANDRVDLQLQQCRRDETPSKPPPVREPANKNGTKATHKKVVVQVPEHNQKRERTSSPITEPMQTHHQAQEDLARLQGYAKEHLEEFRDNQAHPELGSTSRSVAQPTAAVSKVAESQDSSEDEQPQPRPQTQGTTAKKRSLEQIDYDHEKLATMAYADLDATPFLSDPRTPAPKAAVNSTGNPINLASRLASLNQMNAETQKALFRSLTDAENVEVGQWFVEKFGDSLKTLMEQRLARRKVALRYELEAKKRQRQVELRSADLDGELSELRKGGNQLIEGRASPRPKAA
ncbi:uncharacterized protein HMPREF1541_02140 [Cyphellophora europaea CBS 101466]|uniref:Extracellular mutant protein 11 C-terminal domain-containing protein n=1 Tax=Cyphellophora europaea (strain CBS 101466) TaxID=1220924 RepID=W2S2S6_CYPE1|nr:uncharacterized protein HMPREF1541_02140 [Cyphellophora europaea CBS 101466]ETN42982.1 hypothetical protein HMPREF1541_02140 [Cyphellophora europaea CBS 101466]